MERAPITRIVRRLRRDRTARILTTIGIVLLAALFFCFKSNFCSANLPRPQFTFDRLGFKDAQRLLCFEEELQKLKGWNLSYHQGGNGPWVPKVKGVVQDNQRLPVGCEVDQVHMVSITPSMPTSQDLFACACSSWSPACEIAPCAAWCFWPRNVTLSHSVQLLSLLTMRSASF